MGANFGIAGLDWQQRINWARMRKYRLERARERMKAHGLGAVLCMYDENCRYLTGTLTPGWNRLKPGLRYALLCGDGAPVLFEQGDLGFQIERHSPWIPKENVRYSYAWIKGAAGPASQQQVKKFTDAILYEMKRYGLAGQKLGVDSIDINMINIFKDKKINWVDGMTPMMEARAVKNVDEQECMRIVGSIGDATHWECMKFLRPGITENQVTAHLMKYLYSFPGMEDVEDDRLVRPQYLAELAQFLRSHHPARRHRVHGFGRAHLERLQILLLPHLLRRQGADEGAEGHLRHRARMALRFDPRGEGRHHHARDREEMAVREGGLGLQGRGPGGGESVGPRPRARAVRPAGDLTHLVARPSGRDPGRNDLRARDPARQALPLRRAHRGDADRAREGDRDHLELPGQADHRGRSDPRLRRPREMIDVCA